MKNLAELKKACDDGATMALATSVGNVPNVRIVNYVWYEETPSIIYFTSDMENDKVKEFGINSQVAIYTFPTDTDAGTTLRSNSAMVRKSSKSIKDVQDLFVEKIPSYGEALEFMGDTLTVFEVVMEKALITVDFENTILIDFSV